MIKTKHGQWGGGGGSAKKPPVIEKIDKTPLSGEVGPPSTVLRAASNFSGFFGKS